MAGLRVGPHLGEPAARGAFYHLARDGAAPTCPLTIDVLRIIGGKIAEITTFHDDQFPRLGLPERLAADGTLRR